ncbi:MAG: C4-dicarboxylate TRAP transporter substrate-binding protein [Pseudomonadota bacterium]
MRRLTAMALAGAVLAMPASAETYNLTIASSHPTVLPWVGVMQSHIVAEANARLEAIGSADRIEWTEDYGGALYGFQDTLEAVEDGITDVGWVGTLWEESKMPYQSITYYAPFVIDSQPALMEVMNELHATQPVMTEAWQRRNQVYLGASGVETYHIMTNFPVNSIDDLRGKKILAPGPAGNWISALGAVPVNGSLTTYYNQLETGVADGCITIISGFYPNRLYEVAPYVTLVGIGAHFTGGVSVNLDTWDGLSDDVQKVLGELGYEYSAIHAEQVEARYTDFVQKMRDDPEVTVTELPVNEKARWIAALPNIAGGWADNLEQGDEVLAAFMNAVRERGVEPGRNWDRE